MAKASLQRLVFFVTYKCLKSSRSTKILLLDNVFLLIFGNLGLGLHRVMYVWKLSDDFCLILNELMNELFTEKRQTLQRDH